MDINDYIRGFGNAQAQYQDALHREAARQGQHNWTGGLGQAGAQQQPQGRTVTKELENEMITLRCGNLLKDASESGWRVRVHHLARSFLVSEYKVEFINPRNGEQMLGPESISKQVALVLATEKLAQRYKI